MKYLDHLKELRNRLLVSFLFLIISFIFFFYNASLLGEILSKPLFKLLVDGDDKRMIFTGLPEVFVSNLKISLFASFILSMPFLIVQIVLFLSPAMYKKEKKSFYANFFFNSNLIFFWDNFCILCIDTFYLVFLYIV